jgi:hypothetical protein
VPVAIPMRTCSEVSPFVRRAATASTSASAARTALKRQFRTRLVQKASTHGTLLYSTLPAYVWALPPRQLSDEVARAIVKAARCYTPGCRGLDYMAANPEAHLGEYMTIKALAAIDPDELIAALHEACPEDDYPISYLDPKERRPPFGGGHA